jgi:hypothetical protein
MRVGRGAVASDVLSFSGGLVAISNSNFFLGKTVSSPDLGK